MKLIYFLAFIVSCIFSLILTPLFRHMSLKKGFIDKPNKRKVHRKEIPSLGGLAIFASFLLAVVLFIKITNFIISPKIIGLFIGCVVLIGMGIYDDLKDMPAVIKLGGQVLVASIVYFCGFRIEEFFGFEANTVFLEISSFLVTIFWIVGIINAINLLDGLDGLACGICCIVALFLFMISIANQNYWLLIFTSILAGSCLGFLPYNFHPASIFMGDTGSMFLGFILSLLAIESYQKSTTFIAVLVPMIAMAVPIIDTSLSILRRLLSKKPLFTADKNHIHHRLLVNDKSHVRVVLTLYTVTFFFGLISLGLKDIKGIYMIAALIMVSLVTFRWIKNSGFLDAGRN